MAKMLPSKKNEDVHNPAIVNYELQRLANETKHKSAKKKVNLASVRTGKQNDAHLDLLKLVETLVNISIIDNIRHICRYIMVA